MRLAYRVLEFLVFACAVAVILAQAVKSTPTKVSDPILGTWKLNVRGSRNSSPVVQAGFKIAPIKERTETYREVDGSRIERTETTTRTDGSVSASKMIWPNAKGGCPRRAERVGRAVGNRVF